MITAFCAACCSALHAALARYGAAALIAGRFQPCDDASGHIAILAGQTAVPCTACCSASLSCCLRYNVSTLPGSACAIADQLHGERLLASHYLQEQPSTMCSLQQAPLCTSVSIQDMGVVLSPALLQNRTSGESCCALLRGMHAPAAVPGKMQNVVALIRVRPTSRACCELSAHGVTCVLPE